MDEKQGCPIISQYFSTKTRAFYLAIRIVSSSLYVLIASFSMIRLCDESSTLDALILLLVASH